MQISRVKNTKRNIIAVLIASAGEMVINFATRTALIYILGSEYVGLSGLFLSILRIMNMMEIGFASSVAFSMYKPIAEADIEEVCAILKFSRKVYQIMGILMILAGLIILPLLPYFIKEQVPNGVNIYILFILYILDLVLEYFFFSYYSSLVTALQRMSRIRIIRLIVHIIECILQITILILTSNYYLFMVMSIIATLIINITIYWSIRRDYPEYIPYGDISDELKIAIRERVLGILLGYAGGIVFTSIASITLSKYHGLTSVAIYDNYYIIYGGLCTVFSYVTEAMKASVGNSIAIESVEKNYSDLRKFTFIYMWITSICTVCLLCMYQPFMNLWVGRELMISDRSTLIIVATFYLSNTSAIMGTYFSGVGLWWKMKGLYILDVFVSLIFPFVLGRYFAIAGIMFAFLVQNLIIRQIPLVVIMFKTYFKTGLKEYIKSVLVNLAITAVSCLISLIICGLLPWGAIVSIIVGILVCLVVSVAMLYIVNFRTDEFKEAYCFVKSNIGI